MENVLKQKKSIIQSMTNNMKFFNKKNTMAICHCKKDVVKDKIDENFKESSNSKE